MSSRSSVTGPTPRLYQSGWLVPGKQPFSEFSAAHSDPIAHLQVYRKIHACALELLAKLGHSYVISTLSREPLFSISEDREVVCKEGALQILQILQRGCASNSSCA